MFKASLPTFSVCEMAMIHIHMLPQVHCMYLKFFHLLIVCWCYFCYLPSIFIVSLLLTSLLLIMVPRYKYLWHEKFSLLFIVIFGDMGFWCYREFSSGACFIADVDDHDPPSQVMIGWSWPTVSIFYIHLSVFLCVLYLVFFHKRFISLFLSCLCPCILFSVCGFHEWFCNSCRSHLSSLLSRIF